MGIDDLLNLIANAGFPIAVCSYLLFRLEKQLNALSSSINKLNMIVSAKLGVPIDTTDESTKDTFKVVK